MRSTSHTGGDGDSDAAADSDSGIGDESDAYTDEINGDMADAQTEEENALAEFDDSEFAVASALDHGVTVTMTDPDDVQAVLNAIDLASLNNPSSVFDGTQGSFALMSSTNGNVSWNADGTIGTVTAGTIASVDTEDGTATVTTVGGGVTATVNTTTGTVDCGGCADRS